MLRFSGVARSHTGLVRTGNEDSGYAGPTLLLVADGVGGAAAGEVASATVAHAISSLALAALADPEASAEPVGLLARGVDLAQRLLTLGVRRDRRRAGMATTLTAVATDGARCALAHVGDSRGYVFSGGELTRVTRDDTFVQRMVDDGSLSPEDVPSHPWRNIVVRSLGGDLDPDSIVPPERATITQLRLAPGDRVLLASDGLSDLVAEDRIERVLATQHDDAAVESLVDAALQAGGRDNITCLLATVVDAAAGGAEEAGADVTRVGVLVGAVRDPDHVITDAEAERAHEAPRASDSGVSLA